MRGKDSKTSSSKNKGAMSEPVFKTDPKVLILQSTEVYSRMINDLDKIHESLKMVVRDIDLQRKDNSNQEHLKMFDVQKQRAEFYMNLVGYQLAFATIYQTKVKDQISRYEADYGKKKILLEEWVSDLIALENDVTNYGVASVQLLNNELERKLLDEVSRMKLQSKKIFEKLDKFERLYGKNEELEMLHSEKAKLENTLTLKGQEIQRMTEKNQNLAQELKQTQLGRHIETINHEIPYISIRNEDMKSLRQGGWQITSQYRDKIDPIQNTKVSLVGIIGGVGTGKSWVASQLNANRAWRNPLNSISIQYAAQSEGKRFGTLLSSGWNEPIRPREHLLGSQSDSNSRLMEIYKELTDDSRLIENLKLAYMTGSSHLILLVIDQFTQSELEKIQLIKRLIRNSQKNPRLIIVHNFSQVKIRKQVEARINDCLRKVFNFEEQPLFNDLNTLGNEDINQNLFMDEFGIVHLITATEGTEAGDYYNKGPFKFLLSKIDMLENKEMFSFCENFVEFCNTRLMNLTGLDFAIKLEDDKMIANNKQAKITPAALNHSASVFSQGDFEPKYSIKVEWGSEEQDEARVIVDIEVLDSVVEKKSLRVFEGYHYLTVTGFRKDIFSEDEVQQGKAGKMLLAKGTRREGNYILEVKLVESFMTRKQGVEVLEEDSGAGIKRITIEFLKPKEHVI